MRALILAQGGVDARWGVEGRPYLGTPKHQIVVDGERLLARTVRLLQERGVTDIVVTGPAADPRYRFGGVVTVEQDQSGWTWPGINALHGTRPLWSTDERTTLLFGDVFYTDDTADLIVSCDDLEPHWFRRLGKSETTGHRWDEPFAFSFLPWHHERIEQTARTIAEGWRRPDRKPHLWHHMAAMLGIHGTRPDCLLDAPHQTAIDDWTDDFDSPRDWRAWMGRRYADAYRVAVCIPWHGGDDWRQRSFEWTREHWEKLGVDVFVGVDRTGGDWPNRSAARNDAVRQAGPGYDCLFIADSDTFVAADQFWAAAHMAVERQQLVLAFDEYVRLAQKITPEVMGRGARYARRGAKTHANHASGACMVPPAVFESVGGYDERFLSWGGEDRAFWLACNLFHGEAPRIDGPAWHWFHPRAHDRAKVIPSYQTNIDLALRYKIAAAYQPKAGVLLPGTTEELTPDPDAMRAILAEPGAPLDGRR